MGSRGRAGPGEKRSWGRRSALGDVAGLAPRLGGLRRLCSPRGRRPTAWDPARPSLRIRDPGGTGRKRPSEPRPLGARPDEARVLLSKGLSPGLHSVAAAGQARRLRRVPPADFRGAGALRGEGRPGGRCHSGARAPRGRAWAMRAGGSCPRGRASGRPASRANVRAGGGRAGRRRREAACSGGKGNRAVALPVVQATGARAGRPAPPQDRLCPHSFSSPRSRANPRSPAFRFQKKENQNHSVGSWEAGRGWPGPRSTGPPAGLSSASTSKAPVTPLQFIFNTFFLVFTRGYFDLFPTDF